MQDPCTQSAPQHHGEEINRTSEVTAAQSFVGCSPQPKQTVRYAHEDCFGIRIANTETLDVTKESSLTSHSRLDCLHVHT